MAGDLPTHTCPHCGAVSHNPNDVANRYCGRCHHFCDYVDAVAVDTSWIVRDARVAIKSGRYASLTGRVVSVGAGTVLVRLDAGHDVNVNVRNLVPEERFQAVVAAAHDLLDEDRTSWSPEHERLATALAALETRPAAPS